jgi:tetratricopeptide (TPR) repeat protein
MALRQYDLYEVLNEISSPLILLSEGGAGKTTALLYFAARAAERAKSGETTSIPIFINLGRLTKFDDITDLRQLIAESTPFVKDWDELCQFEAFQHRRILYFFDSFNEMPERLQSNAAVILRRFVEKQAGQAFVIASRPSPQIDLIAHAPSQFKTFEILRLTSEQVQRFLQNVGLGSFFDRMPSELRQLAGNPFMLLAIARTLAEDPQGDLPLNRGKLYDRFARGWIKKEERKPNRKSEYSYERVKEPLLAYLAKRMTAVGQTSLVWVDAIEREVENQLEEIHKKIKRRGGMPDGWTVDHCLNEVLADGLLKRTNNQIRFIHQSLQEYFTAIYFRPFANTLVDFTPRLVWDLVPSHGLAETPTHRFVPALLMVTGLLDDATGIVDLLSARNPLLAAAAIASASRVDSSLAARLEQDWLALFENENKARLSVACSCLVLSGTRSSQTARRLVALAVDPDFQKSWVGLHAVAMFRARDAIVRELAEMVRNLTDSDYARVQGNMDSVVKKLQDPRLAKFLFDQWRTSKSGSSIRSRYEVLMESMDKALLKRELEKFRSDSSQPGVAEDAALALNEIAAWSPLLSGRILFEKIVAQETERERRQAEALSTMRSLENEKLLASLSSAGNFERAAAAKVIAERQIPVGDAILESLLRFDAEPELVSALVSLWGESVAVSKLAERSRERCRFLGILSSELTAQLTTGDLPELARAEFRRLGVEGEGLRVVGKPINGTWVVSPSSGKAYIPVYEIRSAPPNLELYDCNVAVRAFLVLAEIPGHATSAELRRALDVNDSNVQRIAVGFLVARRDHGLARRLISRLQSGASTKFVDEALAALPELKDIEALSLLRDLLIMTTDEGSDVHPVWGASTHYGTWSFYIHRILVQLNVDAEVQQRLEATLNSDDSAEKVSALREFARWFTDDLGPERGALWRSSSRVERLVSLALHDSTEPVRKAAVEALGKLNSEFVRASLRDALSNAEVEVQLAAGEALVQLTDPKEMSVQPTAQELHIVAETMLRLTNPSHSREVRQRAGKVLYAIPNEIEAFYRPIKEEFRRDALDRALEKIDAALEILPEDVNLFWWRGHALRNLRRLELAADSFQRASHLEKSASVIPAALAQTYVELGEFVRAIETARQADEIEPGNADLLSILAWSSYKVGAIKEASEAASRAVDLDPVHQDAIWIILLVHIHEKNLNESRSDFGHVQRIQRFLSPGFDVSFINNFLKEIQDMREEKLEMSDFIVDVQKKALRYLKHELPS